MRALAGAALGLALALAMAEAGDVAAEGEPGTLLFYTDW